MINVAVVNRISKFLGSGYAILLSTVCAIEIGTFFPDAGDFVRPIGELFLTFISLSVIPIIFASVTGSIIQLISSPPSGISILRVISTFLLGLFLAAITGIGIGIILNPSQAVLGSELISDMITQNIFNSIDEISLSDPVGLLRKFSFSDFLTNLLPSNPFKAFSDGNILQILSISVLVGIAMANLDKRKIRHSLAFLNIISSLFKRILQFQTNLLPIGLFCTLTSSLSGISIDSILSMWNFCVCAVIIFTLIFLIAACIFHIYSPIGLIKSIVALKKPLTVAFSTCSNQVTLPFLTASLSKRFKLSESAVEMALPLGITMCRVGATAYYAFVTIFVMELYSEPLTVFQMMFIVFGAITMSFAASGATGIAAITMISMILNPLDLSLDSILFILIAVDPLIDPFRTIASSIMNAAFSCIVINKQRRRIA